MVGKPPAFLTAIGAALYFVIFPGHFDTTGEYLVTAAGSEILEQLEAQGLTYSLYVLISSVACLTYAPLINMFVAVGEVIEDDERIIFSSHTEI